MNEALTGRSPMDRVSALPFENKMKIAAGLFGFNAFLTLIPGWVEESMLDGHEVRNALNPAAGWFGYLILLSSLAGLATTVYLARQQGSTSTPLLSRLVLSLATITLTAPLALMAVVSAFHIGTVLLFLSAVATFGLALLAYIEQYPHVGLTRTSPQVPWLVASAALFLLLFAPWVSLFGDTVSGFSGNTIGVAAALYVVGIVALVLAAVPTPKQFLRHGWVQPVLAVVGSSVCMTVVAGWVFTILRSSGRSNDFGSDDDFDPGIGASLSLFIVAAVLVHGLVDKRTGTDAG